MINLSSTDPLTHSSLNSTITSQIITHVYTIICCMDQSNQRILLPRAHNQMALIYVPSKKKFSNVENEDTSCILYMYTYYICMYVSYILYIIINIISYHNRCNFNYNIKFLNFILTMFQTSWGSLIYPTPDSCGVNQLSIW